MIAIRRSLAVLAILLLLLSGAGLSMQHGNSEYGVFSRGDIVVAGGETVGKLLVVDGNAIVDGQVLRWAAVIRGDLIVRDGGRISGGVFVLGGQITAGTGAILSPAYKIVLPPESAAVKTFVGALLAFLAVGLILAMLTGWVIVRWLRANGIYKKLIRRLAQGNWEGFFVFGGFLLSAALLVAFVDLAAETFLSHETEFADQVVIWLVRYFATPALDKAMLIITTLGSGHAYILLAPLVAVGLLLVHLRHECFSLVICLAGAALLNFLLKHLFERSRPDLFRVVNETGYSFPSGHAMVSLCFYGLLAYIVGRRLPWRKRIALYCLTAVGLAAVGISRIYLGVHYPSDVLAGYIAGGTWLAFCISLLWWWEKRKT